ncbi:MAG: cation transporter [Labilithrix sp.]|nr:cation transporter [Labilithrix sp.]MCW5812729.1 cation transporter [Labilithrix sp.]
MAHDHDHGHDHDHDHEHPPSTMTVPQTSTEIAKSEKRASARLVIVLVMISAFFVVELIGAKIARSDVLQADAFHLLMDVFALAISLGAMRVASRKPSPRFTFGLRRAEPLAALTNAVLVLVACVEITRDSIEHLQQTEAPRSGLMIIVASAALFINGINAWLLHGAMGHGHHHHGHSHGHGHDHAHDHDDDDAEHDHDHTAHGKVAHGHQLNLRGAWLHLLGDALGSFAAFMAGLLIRLGVSPIVDPIASFIVVLILFIGAVRLLRDAGLVLLEASPAHLSLAKVERTIMKIEGVRKVHALHVWSLGTGHDAITAHVETSSTDPKLGARITAALRKRFTAEYVTIQVDVE